MTTTTNTKTRRTTAKAAAPAIDPLTPLADEAPLVYLARMRGIGTLDAIKAGERYVSQIDDVATIADFRGRITRSVLAGTIAIGRAAVVNGSDPTGYDVVAKALGLTAKGDATYLGRAYSTMRQCYRLAVSHTDTERDAFMVAYNDATGKLPTDMRDYATWLGNVASGKAATENTAAAIGAKITAKAAVGASLAKAAATAAENAKALAALPTVEGCPLTAEQWDAMSPAVLDMVATYAKGKAAAKRAAALATKAADPAPSDTAAVAANAAAETAAKVRTPRKRRTAAVS